MSMRRLASTWNCLKTRHILKFAQLFPTLMTLLFLVYALRLYDWYPEYHSNVDNRFYILYSWIRYQHVTIPSETKHSNYLHCRSITFLSSRKGMGQLYARMGVHHLRETSPAQSWSIQHQRTLSYCGKVPRLKDAEIGRGKCKLWRRCGICNRHYPSSKGVLRTRLRGSLLLFVGYFNSVHWICLCWYHETISRLACGDVMALNSY